MSVHTYHPVFDLLSDRFIKCIDIQYTLQYCLSVWQSDLGSITFMHVGIHVLTEASLQIMFLLLG